MKKKLKGLLALLMAIAMVVPMAVPAMGAINESQVDDENWGSYVYAYASEDIQPENVPS